ncbi:MAG TPA: S1 RNA-binding domain-containing protein, partial [Verrucomicrobiae bacterium]|nr:S1 RNA-binding domain-containing protein [Verrucomicrobiae bacterium]
YPALVIDVRNFGCFVDVPELGLSGLVHLSSFEDDFFVFEPSRCQLVGRRSRRVIKLCDRVEVQVAKVDTFKKQVDFRMAKLRRGAPQRQPRGQRIQPKSESQDRRKRNRPSGRR